MTQPLPSRPNLAFLKHQARLLLRAYKNNEPQALQRFAQVTAPKIVLAHALFVLAREHGFESWPKLKQYVEQQAQIADRPTRSIQAATRHERRQAHQQQIAERARRMVDAANQRDYSALFTALFAPLHEMLELRAWLLAHDQYTPVVDALMQAAEQPQDRVRFLAAQAMDHYADQRCIPVLERLLYDHVPRVRWAALHSIQCGDCKAGPWQCSASLVETVISMALHDPSIKVRRMATYELHRYLDDARVIAALEQICTHSYDMGIVRQARVLLGGKGTTSAG